MTTPAAVSTRHIDPFVRVVPEYQNTEAPVFVASARTASGKTNPTQFYTTNRSREVRVGLATLEIGPVMTWDELVKESMAAKRSHDSKIKLTAYEEYGRLWSTAWHQGWTSGQLRAVTRAHCHLSMPTPQPPR
jgi:hypothetical protein